MHLKHFHFMKHCRQDMNLNLINIQVNIYLIHKIALSVSTTPKVLTMKKTMKQCYVIVFMNVTEFW